eukprot:5447392-Karenia_brevis.AAC.1
MKLSRPPCNTLPLLAQMEYPQTSAGAGALLQFATRHGRSWFQCRSPAVAHGRNGGLWTRFRTLVVASIVGC